MDLPRASGIVILVSVFAAVGCGGQEFASAGASDTVTAGAGGNFSSGGTSNWGGTVSTGGSTSTGGQSSVTLTFGERPGATCSDVTHDTDINSAAPDLNYGGAPLFGCDSSPMTFGLLQFDLGNCTDQIGTLDQVLAARLRLHTGDCPGCQASGDTTVQVLELLESWQEGTGSSAGDPGEANWNESLPGVTWQGPGATGASRGTMVLGEFNPTTANMDYVIDLPATLVQGWLDQPDTNFGVLLAILSSAVTPTDGVSFGTSEGDSSETPLLEIDFASN